MKRKAVYFQANTSKRLRTALIDNTVNRLWKMIVKIGTVGEAVFTSRRTIKAVLWPLYSLVH